jgi:chromosome segregation ATPase
MTKETQQLIPLENVTAADLYGGADEVKLHDLLAGIKDTAKKMAKGLGVKKKGDRDEIASIAYKVARSKTTLDNAGKEFVADLKNQAKIVDARRRDVREQLDALRDEVREPLNRWEENEQARIEDLTDAIGRIRQNGNWCVENWQNAPLTDIQNLRDEIQKVNPEEFQEFEENCSETRMAALAKIDTAIRKREQYDSEQAELEQLRKDRDERISRELRAQAEREQKERDERIRQEAVEAEERKAKEQREQAERVAVERLQRERDARVRAEREALEAKERAERAKQEAEEQQRQKEATKQAEIEKRARNTRHKGECNSAAADALIQHCKLDPTRARKVVEAIAKGKIPRVTLEY